MKNWYIIHTFSGFEQKVAETLKDTIKTKLLSDKIDEVLVPTHEVTEVKKGKRVASRQAAIKGRKKKRNTSLRLTETQTAVSLKRDTESSQLENTKAEQQSIGASATESPAIPIVQPKIDMYTQGTAFSYLGVELIHIACIAIVLGAILAVLTITLN